MYYEMGSFLRKIVSQKPFWKDGDIWTAVLSAALSFSWFALDPLVVERIRQHFRDLLSAISIIFGFSLTGLVFYIQVSSTWQQTKQVVTIADKIVDRHVWTIVCLLFLLSYLLLLWSVGGYLDLRGMLARVLHSLLVFGLVYCGCQILNHALTIWWSFKERERLKTGKN